MEPRNPGSLAEIAVPQLTGAAKPVMVRGFSNISKVAAGMNAIRDLEQHHDRRSIPAEIRGAVERLFAGRTGVHVDFHANRHFNDFWSLPSHFRSPLERPGDLPNREKR
jgi:hypothetical protein